MRIFLISLFLCFFTQGLIAQVDTTGTAIDTTANDTSRVNPEMLSRGFTPGPRLDAYQLKNSKWYYSINDAVRDPERVYKLSLSGQKYKELPPGLDRFSNLQVLNLSNNKLKTIPADISRLQNLEVLILSKNRINRLPEEIKNMENLTTIYLSNNRLVEVPAWIGGLSKLRSLDLSLNNLTRYEIELVQQRLPRCKITH
ncbi:MAG: leucine-rich repeat domain-containing protein [Bacteroidota bacterium]